MTGRQPPRSTAHDLERYAGLFAQRTKVMKSSAMRDLMALTERADVISLAGGMPDTSTFPADTYASLMATVAERGMRESAAVRPDRGLRRRRPLHRRGDGRGGHGGRRRRAADHDRRPAGDRPRLQDARGPGRRDRRRGADVPGRGPDVLLLRGRRRADRDGRARDAGRRARGDARPARARGPAAEVHLHDPDVPEPGRRDDVAAAPPAAGADRARARAARAGGQPVRPAALRGRPAADALLDGRRRVRHLPRHVLEDPLAGDPTRLGGGATPGAAEDEPRQAGGRPLQLVDDAAVRGGVLRGRRMAGICQLAGRDLPRRGATRCWRR